MCTTMRNGATVSQVVPPDNDRITVCQNIHWDLYINFRYENEDISLSVEERRRSTHLQLVPQQDSEAIMFR